MISREEFEKYEDVRLSGLTNMLDVSKVESLSGLSRDVIIQIMENYEELKEEFRI